jgi:TetR/AcrR family transcriptional regulator, transcriptional repressor of aconitase
MPRITEERREARREQVLQAARACLQQSGLEAVSMEMIVGRSGLSTGAVYGYFKGKDEIINAVVTEGMAELAEEVSPILANPEPSSLPKLVEEVLTAIVDFGLREPGIDRLLVSLHGWSHSQSNPVLKQAIAAAYARLRALYAGAVGRLRSGGSLRPDADPEELAQLLTSLTLGFVAQRALAGGTSIEAHVDALKALVRTT